MKYFFCILLLVFICFLNGQAQTALEKGTVSFVSSRNVYVKFASTESLHVGDSLFVRQNGVLIPALIVSNKSSTSAVCSPMFKKKMKVGDELFFRFILIEKKKEEKELKKEKEKTEETSVEEEIKADEKTNASPEQAAKEPMFKEKIRGRISIASYSNLSDYKNTHRMRYAFSFRGKNLKNSRFSTDNYITFRHTINEWEEVKENLSRALKIYSLSVKYDFNKNTNLTFGRKINSKISNMGAIDGLQFEKRRNRFSFGAIVGSRPDYTDYSVNFNLLQAGAYVSYTSAKESKRFRQTTLGFVEQRNKSNVDRRFVYFQHSSELLKNLNLFGSFELDLYEKIENKENSTLRLTSLYLSLRYRLLKKWRFSLSYDNRKNIIYYESYKSFIDRLIEDETRQGLRAGVNYRPFKNITIAVNSSIRFQKNSENLSKNFSSYVSFSRIPVVNMRVRLKANFLQTNYLSSRLLGISISKQIIRRKLNGDLYFRMGDYQYTRSESINKQKTVGINFSYRLMKKLSLYLYYEGTFSNQIQNQASHRINSKLIKRF